MRYTLGAVRWSAPFWLLTALLLFVLCASAQLGLPGLHYDEAREAGLNSMELLTGAPVTPFRDSAIEIGSLRLPLMVQDYIGALNVYLSLPFLWLTGIGVPNLRASALILAVASLLTLERAISEWMALRRSDERTPIHSAALIAVALLIFSPSFVFWSRQGHFVTNATQPFSYAAIWMVVRWLRTGHSRPLFLASLCGGLALYAKLLAVWVIGPLASIAGTWWGIRRLRHDSKAVVESGRVSLPALSAGKIAATLLCFLFPLLPFILFNWQSGGTFESLSENLSVSYYGVDNRNLGGNLAVRIEQIWTVLAGSHFWYLGAIHANPIAPWLWLGSIISGLYFSGVRRFLLAPLLLLTGSILVSIFTVSDLFITHLALIHPLAIGVAAISIDGLRRSLSQTFSAGWPGIRLAIPGLIFVWMAIDLNATVAYHRALAQSGGLSDHSDASYHLAYALRYGGVGAPIALDWGIDAGVRFLSEGTVRPIEIFGYESTSAPDPAFANRLAPFLEAADPAFLLRAPDQTVFAGRRQAFLEQAQSSGRSPYLAETFRQQDGTPLFELWRLP